MNGWKKPVLINAVIVTLVLVLDLFMNTPENTRPLPRFAFSALLILLLAPINLVIGMVHNRNKKADGPVYIALSGILLLIGFSVCSAPVIFE